MAILIQILCLFALGGALASELPVFEVFTDDIDKLNEVNFWEFAKNFSDDAVNTLGAEGKDLRIQSVNFHIPPEYYGNSTYVSDDIDIGQLLDRDLLGSRAPKVNCEEIECFQGPFALSEPVQKFITGKACPFVAKYSPPVGSSIIGLVFSGAVCKNSKTCNAVITVGFSIAGAATPATDALDGACKASYAAIEKKCGGRGGRRKCVAVDSKGNKDSVTYQDEPNSGQGNTGCHPGVYDECKTVKCRGRNDGCTGSTPPRE